MRNRVIVLFEVCTTPRKAERAGLKLRWLSNRAISAQSCRLRALSDALLEHAATLRSRDTLNLKCHRELRSAALERYDLWN